MLKLHEEGDLEIEEETVIEQRHDDEVDYDWDPEAELDSNEKVYKNIDSPNMVIFGDVAVPISSVEEAIAYYPLPSGSHYRNTGVRRRKPSSMFHKFRFLKTDQDLKRLVKYEKEGKVKADRRIIIEFISTELHKRVLDAISAGHVLHDNTLRSMISEIKDDHVIDCSFFGSDSWLNGWKRAHRISSRNITTFVSRKRLVDKDQMEANMKNFVKEAREKFKTVDPLHVYNLDQSGFQKEMYTKSTLAETGTKIVTAVTSSAGGVRNSYTILPMLRMDGYLHPKLYVVLSEPTGAFPSTQPPFQPSNLVLRAWKGHIMGNALTEDFFEFFFGEDIPDETCLALDSWPLWKKTSLIDNVRPSTKTCERLYIPPGATGKIQPLDVGVFQNFKKFMKNLGEYAQRKVPEFKIHQRDSIIKMLSVTYQQLRSPRFQEWLAYSWHKGGYTDNRPDEFKTPTQYCFDRLVYGKCELPGCKKLSMIRCAYCEKKICFQEFVVDCHECV